jgi:hypothetical protein
MEFLRFGSSIPGSYWGCCACCIIQNFKVDPDDKASIQLVSGDGGGPIMKGREMLFAGPTWKDIFWQRIRSGTFDQRDMPNHAFFAILTDWQINSGVGKKWMVILKEAGFEFVRSVANSVYTGQTIATELGEDEGDSLNYIFGLFRNIGTNGPSDPFTAPKAWQDLPTVKTEAWTLLNMEGTVHVDDLAKTQFAEDKAIWDRIGPPKFLVESEVVAAGAPVILAGLRSENPQEPKATRDARKPKPPRAAKGSGASDPFANAA